MATTKAAALTETKGLNDTQGKGNNPQFTAAQLQAMLDSCFMYYPGHDNLVERNYEEVVQSCSGNSFILGPGFWRSEAQSNEKDFTFNEEGVKGILFTLRLSRKGRDRTTTTKTQYILLSNGQVGMFQMGILSTMPGSLSTMPGSTYKSLADFIGQYSDRYQPLLTRDSIAKLKRHLTGDEQDVISKNVYEIELQNHRNSLPGLFGIQMNEKTIPILVREAGRGLVCGDTKDAGDKKVASDSKDAKERADGSASGSKGASASNGSTSDNSASSPVVMNSAAGANVAKASGVSSETTVSTDSRSAAKSPAKKTN